MLWCLGIYLLTLKFSCINFLLKSTTVPSYSSLWSPLTTRSFQSHHPLPFWTSSLTSPPLISEHDINLDATYINYILQCNKLPPNWGVFTNKHVLSHRNLEVVSCVVQVWGLSWGFRKDVRQVSVIWMLGWGICWARMAHLHGSGCCQEASGLLRGVTSMVLLEHHYSMVMDFPQSVNSERDQDRQENILYGLALETHTII